MMKSVSRIGSGPLLAVGLEVASVLKSIVAVAVVVPLVSLALDVGGLEHLSHCYHRLTGMAGMCSVRTPGNPPGKLELPSFLPE